MFKRIALICCAATAMALSGGAVADNSTKIPGYVIHHNAFTTDALSADIANAYNIRRSSNRAMLNVSIIREANGKPGTAVPATVTAVARNLMGQKREVPMREVREGEAIYYIGDFLVGHRETLDFAIDVTPAGDSRTHSARLSQEFYTR
jgi:hypothetical protein